MFAQINHVALISHQYNTLGKFYEAVFGLKSSAKGRPASAITIGDGYVGLNLIPRRDGYVEGIDHFGMVVDDVEPVLERMKRKHRNAAIVKRPSTRPFAAYSGHDPDGNVFDLAQRKNDTRKEVYAEIAGGGWAQDRYLNKFAIRTPNAEQCAEFYRDVFELEPVSRKSGTGYCLSDGRVTLAILPWSIPAFEGMSIKRPGPDHSGFRDPGPPLGSGPLPQQIRHPHAQRGTMRGILSGRVRARAGEPQVRHGLLSKRWAGDPRHPALVDSCVRGHVDQAPGSGPYRLSCRESGRVQGDGCGSGRDESLSGRHSARSPPG